MKLINTWKEGPVVMSLVEAGHTERKHDPPGGGLWDHLDASRREVVELCGEKGIALFMFLLESSTIIPGQEDIAICPLQRLHDVALQLQASPDTVKRYVAVFRALSLAQHYHDHRREVKLHIPLGPYCSLTNLSMLDELIGKRKKQRQLALKVKNRYITRFGDPTQGYSDEIRTKFQELNTILENEHLEPLKRQRLQMKIADLLTQLVGKAGTSKGDPNGILDDLQAAPPRQEPVMPACVGDSNEGLEAFCLIKKPEPGKGSLQMGDLKQPGGDFIPQGTVPARQQPQQSGDSGQQTGDSTIIASSVVAHQSEQQGDLNQQTGDLVLQQNTQQPHNDDHLGDSNAQVVPKVGDSNLEAVVEVHPSAPATFNVNYLISNISNNVKRNEIAKFLAGILEKHEYENGKPTFRKYLAAFKQYTPEVIGRAFLATMVLLHCKRWRVNSRGATFTNQCKTLSGQQPFVHYTLEEVEEWLRAWGQLPYAELITTLAAAPLSEPAASEPAPLVTAPRQHIVPPSLAQTSKRGLPGHFGAATSNRKKRTYGMHYTGLPSGKGFNTSGAGWPTQNPEKS